MKKSSTKLAKTAPPTVFPQTLHRLRVKPGAKAESATPVAKAAKRENTFSKSRDTREDRGTRQAKTSHKAQTFQHGG